MTTRDRKALPTRSARRGLVLAGVWLGMLLSAPADASQELRSKVLAEGKDDYDVHCAACHGDAGKGDGTMARLLVKPPTDLTRIAAANDGRFPFWRIFEIVAGGSGIAGHDTFQMPHFWGRFRSDDYRLGYREAHIRVLQLTHYLESIQAPPK